MKKFLVFAVAGLGGLCLFVIVVGVVTVFLFSDSVVETFTSPSFQAGYFEGRCVRGNADACASRARIAAEGRFGKPEDATDFFRRACRLGHQASCSKASATEE